MNNMAYNVHTDANERVWIMSKKTWLRLSEAAGREGVPVTAETLRRMINDNRVPKGYYEKRPYGRKFIYWIAEEILPSLDYKDVGKPKQN